MTNALDAACEWMANHPRRTACIVAGAILFAGSLDAPAHDAPTGWTYPTSCCSDIDCREVADDAVLEGPDGYTIRATGETIAMTSHKVRNSPDGRFHWCSVKGADDGATLCLFVPPRGF